MIPYDENSTSNVIPFPISPNIDDQKTKPAMDPQTIQLLLKYPASYVMKRMLASIDDKFEDKKRENRDNFMDNNDLLKAYIEKVDRDQSDLRADIKERERRTTEQINRVESRMDERLNKIESLLVDTQEKISQNTNVIDDKLERFRSDIKEHKFFRITSAIGIIGVCLATIIGIATMVVTVVSMLGD